MIGMLAIRQGRSYCVNEDFMKGVRKILETKKLEGKIDYKKL